MRRTARTQRGAALLLAMLTVGLVATFAAGAVWQQWRSSEIETAERSRVQSDWILAGAMDWSRLILREDGKLGGADHLSEPWAVPLMEAKLSTFLAAERNITVDTSNLPDDAFLSGRMEDMQGRFNLNNLLDDQGNPSSSDMGTLRRLFSGLGLPMSEADGLIAQWQRAARARRQGQNADPGAPLLPNRVEQLGWLGLPAAHVRTLAPYLAILPERTRINANTASSAVLTAALPQSSQADVLRLVAQRASQPLLSFDDLQKALPNSGGGTTLSFSSGYFMVHGALRIGNIRIQEQALVQRNGSQTRMLWRDKASVSSPADMPSDPT